jgi:hypothetical protein
MEKDQGVAMANPGTMGRGLTVMVMESRARSLTAVGTMGRGLAAAAAVMEERARSLMVEGKAKGPVEIKAKGVPVMEAMDQFMI